MFITHLVCGNGGFQEAEGERQAKALSASATATSGSRRKGSNKNKNPFSTRGLDKFTLVLAELEEKKHKICSEMPTGSQDMLVRFRCLGSKDWLPIVVKLKGSGKVRNHQRNIVAAAGVEDHDRVDGGRSGRRLPEQASGIGGTSRKEETMTWWLLMVFLVFLFLLVCGRSFAIMCACILWYLIPKMREGNEGRWRKGKSRSTVR